MSRNISRNTQQTSIQTILILTNLLNSLSNLTVTDGKEQQLLFIRNRRKATFSYLSNKNPLRVTYYSAFSSKNRRRGFQMWYFVLNGPLSQGRNFFEFTLAPCIFFSIKCCFQYPSVRCFLWLQGEFAQSSIMNDTKLP